MAVPIELIIFHPVVISLISFSSFMFVFLFMIIMRTPAMTFLKAGFGKKMILINPDEDRRMMFRIANKKSDMAYVKNKGYYIIDPSHVYIESSSKIPTTIVYGSFAESITTEDGRICKLLDEKGVKNYADLIKKLTDEITAKEALEKGYITKEQYEENPGMMLNVKKDADKIGKLMLNGESVGFDKIINYFQKNTRADLIESNIQHRISAIKADKNVMKSDMFKWAVVLVVIMIGAALAYSMLTMNAPAVSGGGGVGGIVGAGASALGGTGLT